MKEYKNIRIDYLIGIALSILFVLILSGDLYAIKDLDTVSYLLLAANFAEGDMSLFQNLTWSPLAPLIIGSFYFLIGDLYFSLFIYKVVVFLVFLIVVLKICRPIIWDVNKLIFVLISFFIFVFLSASVTDILFVLLMILFYAILSLDSRRYVLLCLISFLIIMARPVGFVVVFGYLGYEFFLVKNNRLKNILLMIGSLFFIILMNIYKGKQGIQLLIPSSSGNFNSQLIIDAGDNLPLFNDERSKEISDAYHWYLEQPMFVGEIDKKVKSDFSDRWFWLDPAKNIVKFKLENRRVSNKSIIFPIIFKHVIENIYIFIKDYYIIILILILGLYSKQRLLALVTISLMLVYCTNRLEPRYLLGSGYALMLFYFVDKRMNQLNAKMLKFYLLLIFGSTTLIIQTVMHSALTIAKVNRTVNTKPVEVHLDGGLYITGGSYNVLFGALRNKNVNIIGSNVKSSKLRNVQIDTIAQSGFKFYRVK